MMIGPMDTRNIVIFRAIVLFIVKIVLLLGPVVGKTSKMIVFLGQISYIKGKMTKK